jgi:hypothetical protein
MGKLRFHLAKIKKASTLLSPLAIYYNFFSNSTLSKHTTSIGHAALQVHQQQTLEWAQNAAGT